MLDNKKIHAAFVSTNSICQGVQVATLWGLLFNRGIRINFAYTSFPWTNAATNAATVTCIIVGFSYDEVKIKYLYEINKDNLLLAKKVKNISPYLIEEESLTIVNSEKYAIGSKFNLCRGSQPTDGGNLLLSYEEGQNLINSSHPAAKFLKKFVGSDELINGGHRYCLWLKDEDRTEWEQIPYIMEKVNACRKYREESKQSGDAYKLRNKPWSFREQQNPKSAIVVPRVSSERRFYIPVGIVAQDTIVGDSCFIVPEGDYITFSIMVSRMHMTWMRLTSGKLKSDYRYSRDLTYNTFIWPDLTDEQKAQLKQSAKNILKFNNPAKNIYLHRLTNMIFNNVEN